MTEPGQSDEAVCFHCGAPTEIQLGEIRICERCYEVRSSCCCEFEEDDPAAEAKDGG